MKTFILLIFSISYFFSSYGQKINNFLVPYNQNHKWGFATIDGNITIKPIFDSVGNFYDGYAEAYKSDDMGFIDTKGNWIVPPLYYSVRLLDKKKKLFEVAKEFFDKDSSKSILSGIYKQNTGLITRLKYYSVKEYNSQKYALEGADGKNYLVDLKSKKITRLHDKEYFDCSCGRANKQQQNEKLHYQKYLKTRPPLEELNTIHYYHKNKKTGGYFVNDTIYNAKEKKWIKFIDSIPALYDAIVRITDNENELFYVRLNSKWGVVNNKGKSIVPPLYDTIVKKDDQPYFTVKKNNKFGIFKITGEIIFDCNQDQVIIPCGYSTKFLLGKTDGKWVITNNYGKTLFENTYDTVKINCYWGNDCAIVKKNNKYGIIDTNGILKYAIIYDDLKFSDSFLIYKLDGLYGVKNFRNNKEIITPEWDMITASDGYYNDGFFKFFIIKKGSQYGVQLPMTKKTKNLFFPLASTGKIELPPTYLFNDKFEFNVFGIYQEDKFYYVGENFIKFTNN